MKKILLLIAIFAVGATAVRAQATYGVKGGLNLATLTNSDDGSMKPSIYLGAFAEWRLGDIVAISPELVYSRQGVAANGTLSGVDVKTKLRFNYLNIPVLAKLYVLDDLSLDLGPQFGILLNARAWMKADGTSADAKYSNAETLDVSFALGLSYNIDRFIVQGRYNLGLTQADKNLDTKNSVLQLGVGYRF